VGGEVFRGLKEGTQRTQRQEKGRKEEQRKENKKKMHQIAWNRERERTLIDQPSLELLLPLQRFSLRPFSCLCVLCVPLCSLSISDKTKNPRQARVFAE
jgi:hypothetical protein